MDNNLTIRTLKFPLLQFVPAIFVGAFLIVAALTALESPPPVAAQEDTTAPTVSSIAITSDPDDDIYEDVPYLDGGGETLIRTRGIYGIGDDIEVTVTFSEDVTVTGDPRLHLNLGGTQKVAGYLRADESTVVFGYTVVEGDSDADGVAIDANKLGLNGGSIRDDADNNADLSHGALAAQATHGVDGIRPRLSVSFLTQNYGYSTSTEYKKPLRVGDGIWFQVRTSNEDTFYASPKDTDPSSGERSIGTPQLMLDFDGEEKVAYWWSTASIGTLFVYEVQEGDLDTDGVAVKANSIRLNGGFIKDKAGNDAVLTHNALPADPEYRVDAALPTVSSVAITSDPAEDGTYDTGDKIEVTLTFSESVAGSGQRGLFPSVSFPYVELNIGGEAKRAYFQNNSWSPGRYGADVVFAYTVQASDSDEDGISIGANKLHMNGGCIADAAGNNPISASLKCKRLPSDSVVNHDALADDLGHKVAGSSSTLSLSGATTVICYDNCVDLMNQHDDLDVRGNYRVRDATGNYKDSGITWSLSGDDASLFSLLEGPPNWHPPGSKFLRFNSPPNYEDPEDADADRIYRLTIEASEDGNSVTLEVVVVPILTGRTNSPATGHPSIHYTDLQYWDYYWYSVPANFRVGKTIRASSGSMFDYDGMIDVIYGWFGSAYSYQWLADDAEISGATGSTYTLAAADEGKAIKVRMSFIDDNGYYETRTSEATDPVAPAHPPAPTNLAASDNRNGTLSLTWDAPDDESVTGYQILRRRPDEGERTLLVYVADTGSTDTTWTDTEVTIGTPHVYRVKAINEAGLSRMSNYDRVTPAAPPENSPATGVPTISGTARVGETLTADTSGISDGNGLSNATFNYQWLADDADISGATGSSYTLAAAEQGKAVKVRVSFIDDNGYYETRTSEATAAVAAPQPDLAFVEVAVGLSSNPEVGDTFTLGAGVENFGAAASAATTVRFYVSTDATIDASDTEVGTYSLPALAASGFTAAYIKSLTLPDTAGTYYYGACVDAVAGESDTTNNCTAGGHKIVVGGMNSPATGAPAITGTVQVGKTVTADTSGIADANGLNDATFSYQWLADNADISAATSSSYTLVDADKGKAVKVRVSFTDDAGNEESVTSPATAAVAAPPKPARLESAATEEAGRGMILTFTKDIGFSGLHTDYTVLVDGTRRETRSAFWDGTTVGLVLKEVILWDETVTVAYARPESGALLFDADEVPVESFGPVSVENTVPRPENAPATGAPAITGTAQVGETLAADTSGIADADGLNDATFSYQWLADNADISGAAGSSYTLAPAEIGKAVKVRVSFTDDAGNEESVTSAATAAVAPRPNNPATGGPTITGTAQVGGTLAADTSGISDDDGMNDVTFSYQWLADDADISGATESSYTLAAAERGKAVKVRVSFIDDAGHDETLTSAATAAVAPPPLTASFQSVPTEHDGSRLFTFELHFSENFPGGMSYKKLRDQAFQVENGNVKKAARVVKGENRRWTISVRPASSEDVVITLPATTDCSAAGAVCTDAGRKLSNTTSLTVPGPVVNSPATGAPAITGTAQVGETLTADTSGVTDDDGLANASFSYQWLADDADIAGATGSTYTLAASDEGKAIKVRVSFTDDAGNEESLTSAATAAVAPRPNNSATGAPTVTGAAQVGETLTADTSGISDADGLANATFSYQWLADGSDIAEATGATYTLAASDEGKAIKVRVSFTDDAGYEENLTSGATAAVALATG